VGDTVRVHYRITEGEKDRIQVFQGVVIRRSGGDSAAPSRCAQSPGLGVERIFPAASPNIDKLEVVSSVACGRAKLYYLRDLQGKKARLREVRTTKAARACRPAATE